MRRMLLVTSLVVAALLVSGAVGYAAGNRRPAAADQGRSRELRPALGAPDADVASLRAAIDRMPRLGAYLPRAKVDCQTLECLNKFLTKLTKGLDAFEKDMLDFQETMELFLEFASAELDKWEKCIRIIQVSQYGIPPTEGYEYSFPDNSIIKTGAIQFTLDPAIDAFKFMMIWRQAAACPVITE